MHTEGHILTQYCSGRILIETGTCYGRTVEFALANGAKSVRSVEGYRERYENLYKTQPIQSKYTQSNPSNPTQWNVLHGESNAF